MNNLKKKMGWYKAADVDSLLFKIRGDYEQCLKEQKERIFLLREENSELARALEQHKANQTYIIGAITRAEETAQSIIEEAEKKARDRLKRLESEEKQIRMAVEGCCQRLYKLRRASEAVFRAVQKVMGEHEEEKAPAQRAGIHAVKIFPAMRSFD